MPDTFHVIEKEKMTEFSSAKEAGAAFFEADREKMPSAFREFEKSTATPHGAVQSMAKTQSWEHEEGETQYKKALPSSDKQVDKDFNAGYFEALEKSVTERLKNLNWGKANQEKAELDQHLRDDLRLLSSKDFEKAAKAWEDHAPKDFIVPPFIDRELKGQKEMEDLGIKTEGKGIDIENSITDGSERLKKRNEAQQKGIDNAKGSENNRQEKSEKSPPHPQKEVAEAEKPKLPVGIEERYINVEGGFFRKKQKFFDRNNSNVPAFIDKGKSITTNTSDKQVIADMVAIAKSKNWTVLNLKGSKEFRQSAWLEAESQGIKTVGYKPKEADLATLRKLADERSINQISGNERQIKQPEKKLEPTALNLVQRAKVDAAQKVFYNVIKELPPEQQTELMKQLQAKLSNPANIDRLPTPQHRIQERIMKEPQMNRER